MKRKIPPEAYGYYLGLGSSRSYEGVAKHFGVSKRSVTNLAVKEGWQDRIQEADRQTRQRAEEKAQESIEEMNERHLRTMQLIQKKALDTLRQAMIGGGMDAVRALVMAVRDERLIRGEPTDRSALNVEEIIRGQHDRWMVPEGNGVNGHAERVAASAPAH